MTERHREDAFEQGVMVDVGPGSGAIVIYTGDHLAGQEIEISPLGDDSRRVHTDVLRRRTGTGMCRFWNGRNAWSGTGSST